MQKQCSKCSEVKPFTGFYRMKAHSTGYGPWCKACMDANRKRVASENQEREREVRRQWEKRNPEIVRISAAKKRARTGYKERMRAYSQQWYEANKDRLKPIRAAWHQENYEEKRKPKMVQNEANRRARKRNAGGEHTLEQVDALYVRQKQKCAACRISLHGIFHRDHVVPLAAGGSNDISNIQLLCPDCNRSKGARSNEEFMRRRGYLL